MQIKRLQKQKKKRPHFGRLRVAHLITMNPSVIYIYLYFCHKLVFLANHCNQLISWESLKELYGQRLDNHKDDSDLFPLQYNHGVKSLGELITTKVIGQSTAASVSKCGMTFRYLKKAHERDPTNGLRIYLGSTSKFIIKNANNFISCKIYIETLRSAFYFLSGIHMYTCIYMYIQKTCDSRLKELFKSIYRVSS